jgi:hypothetical protein
MKIQTIQGSWDDSCTTSNSLTQNAAKKPFVRDVIEYADARTLSTMIVSGARTPWDLRTGDTTAIKTKIGKIPDGKAIGDQAMRYKVQGRIQKKSAVIAQVGTTTADGYFILTMKDSQLYPGQMVKFYRDHFYARVSGNPTKVSGGYNYTFHNPNELFVSATHLHPIGESFAFGAYTSYGEASLRGYSRSFFPSEFIQHMTTQRKGMSLTGDALTDVTWYVAGDTKGWKYTKEIQLRIQFMMENEHAKWDGTSSMKNSAGELLSRSLEIDPGTGKEIVRGDGVLPLIEGGNEHFGSGADGKSTIDDVTDMMKTLEKRSNKTSNNYWYMVTGTDGYAHYQNLFRDYWVNQLGGNVTHSGSSSGSVGGGDIEVGQNFDTFNINGNKVILCKNVAWDDEEKWYERGSNGELIRGNMAVFLDPGSISSPNIEIVTKGAYGINRSMVEAYLNGLTGADGQVLHSVDAIAYEMLKQDMINIYNTTSCGIINMSPN